jgi:DNA end-binding protein Ku
MRSIWTGAISFGLINIPVKLYPAVKSSSLDLDMLDKKDNANIKFKRVNENTGKEVPYSNIVKGYLYHDKYVVLGDEDFEIADAKKTSTIEIQNFVREEEIESIYYEQPYFLEPDKSGAKAFGLLRDALSKSQKVGVTTFVLRNKEALAILKPYMGTILLNRIRFEQEIREIGELNLPSLPKSSRAEQQMAVNLIEQLTVKFNISKFKDTYTDKLLKIIAQKAKSRGRLKAPHMKVVHKSTSDDLVSMLKASLNEVKKAS